MPFALNLLGLVLAVGVPALIAQSAPRRWRVGIVLLWALAPLLVVLAVVASEAVTGAADLGKLVNGLLLIGSFLLLPWLIAVGMGFALGAFLRRRRRDRAVAGESAPEGPTRLDARAAPVAYAPPVDADRPTLSPPSGWVAAHVGVDHDDLAIDGLPVWSLPWREETGVRVALAHPAHPAQRHEFRVYNIDDGTRAARFAAAELSNGAWGFYRWVVPADAVAGESADGSLRYEHDLGPYANGRYDSIAPRARLHDTRSGALLFDGAAWRSSRVVPQADGALLLSLEQGELQTIFRIDPPAAAFGDLAITGHAQPLAELAHAAAAARASCDAPANSYLGRRLAPDGSLMVELQSVEWGSGRWARSPRVTEIATGRVLLDLWGTDWDAVASFPRDRAVRLSLRRYHAGGGAEVELELAPERYVLYRGSGAVFGPLHDLPMALDAAAIAKGAHAPPGSMARSQRLTARNGLVALLILAGALGLIAVGTSITLRLQGHLAPRRLDTVPPMPAFRPAIGATSSGAA